MDHTADLHTRARRRVAIKLSWLVHAFVYAAVNAGLFAIDALGAGERWSHWPLLGWGPGLAVHGLVALAHLHGDGWRDRMVATELERLSSQGRR